MNNNLTLENNEMKIWNNTEQRTNQVLVQKGPSVVFSKLVNNKGTNNVSITSLNDFNIIFGEVLDIFGKYSIRF